MKHCHFEICEVERDHVTIRDIGPWDRHPTVTNDADFAVETLAAHGYLKDGRKLRYYDSEGRLDEIIVENGKFAGFKPLSELEVR